MALPLLLLHYDAYGTHCKFVSLLSVSVSMMSLLKCV